MQQDHIRNFCIIAHIDHGKSTLADRILELTGAIDDRQKKEQFLDRLDLERERGITIKAQAVRLGYTSEAGQTYQFNLIDTPGHVDFHYEVSRSLAACEGALLVVDAAQGVEAQTLANVYLAVDQGLEVIPVINKIDLPGAEPERVRQEIEDIIGIDASGALLISAKSGEGVAQLLEAIVHDVPCPSGDVQATVRALIFDSWFDSYQGAVVQVRVVDGSLHKGDEIRFMESGREYQVTALGVYSPFVEPVKTLSAGEVGFCAASIKTIVEARTGETITSRDKPADEPLPGFRESQSMVFAGLYPVDSDSYEALKEALERLQLNDASLEYEAESSKALGFGFRCGFLGLLHLEIVQERLEREFGVALITTAPTVPYQIHLTDGEILTVANPAQWPDTVRIDRVEEPYIEAVIHTPNEYVGPLIGLCERKRGQQKGLLYVTSDRVLLTYLMPMNEIVLDFYDQLKSMSRGYASMDYNYAGYEAAALVKMEILLNGEPVDALSVITHKEFAYVRGRDMIERLRKAIPRQLYDVALQAAIGNRVIARETIKALRKNVTAKCYGGDISRKRKLLEKQKAGKKRMKQVGRIEVPQEAFMTMLRVGERKKDD